MREEYLAKGRIGVATLKREFQPRSFNLKTQMGEVA
jgi:hypothetical protein